LNISDIFPSKESKLNFTQYGCVYVLRSIRHEHIANDETAGANLNSRAALEESPEMVMMTTVALSR
jgi:hypothetical protein